MFEKYNKFAAYLYWLPKALLALGLAFALVDQEWKKSILIFLILALTYVPTVLKLKYRLYLPIEFDLFIVSFIFFSLFLGEVHDFYHVFWWWDLYLHLESGFLFGIVGFVVVYIFNAHENIYLYMRPFFVALFAFTFAITIGVMWEIFEYFMDTNFGFNMQVTGLDDTFSDLIFGALGAFVISFIGYFWLRRKLSFFIFDRSIAKFVKKNSHLFGR